MSSLCAGPLLALSFYSEKTAGDDPQLTASLRHSHISDPASTDQSTGIFPTAVPHSFHTSMNSRMSTKHIRTIGDLVRFGAGLRIECSGCGAARTLDGYEAAKIGGGGSRLSVLAGRLECLRCGAKQARLMILPPA